MQHLQLAIEGHIQPCWCLLTICPDMASATVAGTLNFDASDEKKVMDETAARVYRNHLPTTEEAPSATDPYSPHLTRCLAEVINFLLAEDRPYFSRCVLIRQQRRESHREEVGARISCTTSFGSVVVRIL